ncbi:transglutaminase domain-containing protein [Paenibacillaceae bacterium WGS1546]|uniref:transglutaminase domain-containing protein n=1 Tax=Cohnella sp. WGS1546 TaxID=3366810 RepID=UPI00372D3458
MKLLRLFLLAAIVLAGCEKADTAVPSSTPTPTPTPAVVQSIGTATTSGTTVMDLKKKYSSTNDNAIMPLYNVPYDNVFTFKFNTKFRDVLPSDIISVHTDVKALNESKILSFANFTDYLAEKDTIEVSPSTGVLVSTESAKGLAKGWGNAPVYYIRINYDMEAETPTKLEQPVIVPFTVKSDLPVPTVNHEISEDGRLKLTWKKVEGAESYRIYNRSKITLLETTNLPVTGAEEGYVGSLPRLVATVAATEFDDFMANGSGGLTVTESGDSSLYDLVSQQNLMVNGEYYVTAVGKDGEESNFSAGLNTTKLSKSLPHELAKDNPIMFAYPTVADLPRSVEVTFIDGSSGSREIEYQVEGLQASESGPTRLNYTVKGTAFRGYLSVDRATQQELNSLASSVAESSNGLVEPANDTDYVPEPDVPTIINADNEGASDDPGEENDLVERQKKNTQEQVSSGDQEVVPVPASINDVPIHADSAGEEYLALSLIDGQENISLKAFPELQNFESLKDVLMKVYYQNPLILGLSQYRYDYVTLTLSIKYEYSRDEIARMQREIVAEAANIVSGIIQDGMSDDAKRLAIYDYLNDNTKYDDEALRNAEENQFKFTDPKFNDSFNTYGIMVKKVGVCASYASTYKMLSDLAGLQTIVVTGTMNGVPHAWNKVKLDVGWANVDPTNNETNSGIPYLLYNSSDELAESGEYALDDSYWLDLELSQFDSLDNSQDYYVQNGLEVQSVKELTDKLSDNLKNGKWTTIVRYVGIVDQEALYQGVGTTVSTLAQDRLSDTKMGTIGSYVVVISE